MLTDIPPAPENAEKSQTDTALFLIERVYKTDGFAWTRELMFVFDGEAYRYTLHIPFANSEEGAKRLLCGAVPDREVQAMFLKDVSLNMTRPH